MKKLALFLFSLFLFFVTGFTVARLQPQIKTILSKNAIFEKSDAELIFKPTPYPLQNRPFVITIVGYNNGASVDKTIRSVLSQLYENFRVIYIDDGSNDGSFDHARDLIYDSGQGHKVHLIQNPKPLGLTANLLRAIESCDDNEIVIIVDGEDFLAHEWVLQKLNQYYANADLWMTFGSSMHFPEFTTVPNIPLPSTDFRKTDLGNRTFHLKTFYAALFKKIEKSDLIYHGEFMPDTMDLAYMIPLLEMANGHVQSLPEILYLVTKQQKKEESTHRIFETAIQEHPAYSSLPQLLNRDTL